MHLKVLALQWREHIYEKTYLIVLANNLHAQPKHGILSSFLNVIFTMYVVTEVRFPWQDCVYAQSDPGMHILHMT